MTVYFFRAEAANMTPTMYDTSDISTIRGAGFYLLDRIHSLSREIEFQSGLVTEGASAAVFKFNTDNPGAIREKMLTFLYNNFEKQDISGKQVKSRVLPEMTFIVEFIEHKNSFQETMAELQGKIRVSQMQNPTIRIFPETLTSSGKSKDGKTRTFDALNRVLPARETDTKKGEVSEFTKARRREGIYLRRKIYSELLEKHDIPETMLKFTDNLEELSKDPAQGNLNGKIAYIYIDGNKFGKLQGSLDEKALKEFDTALDTFKKEFLFRLIQYALENTNFLFNGNGNNSIRLETLLWGGDEIKLIVPAWLGWTVANLFFQTASDLDLKFENKDLTYAMGMVLTHHKNPIRNIDEVAGMLVSSAKAGLKSKDEQAAPQYKRVWGDKMHYIVLESLETLPQKDYQTFTKKQYKARSCDLALSPGDMNTILNFTIALKNAEFSRSRIHKIAKAWLKKTFNEEQSEYSLSLQRGLDLCNINKTQKDDLFTFISNVTGTTINESKIPSEIPEMGFRWLQIAELWDYIARKGEKN